MRRTLGGKDTGPRTTPRASVLAAAAGLAVLFATGCASHRHAHPPLVTDAADEPAAARTQATVETSNASPPPSADAAEARHAVPPQPDTPVGAVPPAAAQEIPKAREQGAAASSGGHVDPGTTPPPAADGGGNDQPPPAAQEVPDATTPIGTVQEKGMSGPCDRPKDPNAPSMVSSAQLLLEETSCGAALWLDGLFGDDRNYDSARRTSGRLETSVAYSEFKGTQTSTRLRVRINLPNLEKRLSAFFGRDDEEDFIRDRSEGFAIRSDFPRIKDSNEWLAGLGYELPKSDRLQADVRVGVAGVRNPRVFVQAPARYILYADHDDLLYARATPFWRSTDGIGITAGVDYNHVLGESFLLRLLEVGTNSQRNEGYDWLTAAILYQNLRRQRAIAYELFVRGQTNDPEPLYEYGVRAIYRHPLVRDHLYAEFLTGYSFPRDDPDEPRKGSYSVGMSLEVPFGRRP